MRITIFYKCLALLLVCIIITASYIYYCFNSPLNISADNISFDIVRGDSISKVADQLHQSGMLQHDKVFVFVAYVTRQSRNIKAGEYLISKNSTAKQLLEKFASGDVVKRQITFLEGWTFKQILEELKHNDNIEFTINGLSPEAIMGKLELGNENPEGRFFPDSYRYEKGIDAQTILRMAYERMNTILQEEWRERDQNVPYKNAYEALIMASIIEKETGAPDERARIAAVFVNRLKLGMPLQTDPTVIYGLGDAYKGNLTRAHLLQDTPYNTYTRVGLPPTPIASAGKAAIHAALHPASEKVLYFVGKGDGTHYFSQTLTEHNQAVRQYQLNINKSDYHSSPSR